MSLTTRNTALLAAILLSATTMAGDIQQVECTNDGCGSIGCTSEGCNTRTKHTRCQNCRNKKSQCESCNACDSCDSSSGKCSMRDRRNAFALDWCSKCGPIGRRAAKGRPLAKMLHWHGTTKAYPDSGWAPPQTVPLMRANQSYTAYNNFGMGGYAPAAPMIYQPTDTAQQGYSYSNVPQWQPNPGMIPPVPRPSNFHNRFCPSGQCGSHMIGQSVYYETMPSSCPSCDISSVQQPQQQFVTRSEGQSAAVVSMAAPKVAAAKPAVFQPIVSKVQAITPPPIVMSTNSGNSKPQLKQVSQQRTVRPANQTAQNRVRPSNNARRNQQQSGGWFGLPSLRDIKF